MARPMRSPTPTGSRTPPFHVGVGEEREGERGGKEGGGAAPLLVQFGLEGEGARGLPWPPLLFSTKAHLGPLNPPGGSGNPRYSEKYPNHSEPFRCPNLVVQYIYLYVSTILRLLVMSPISSGTPNNIWYIKTHKLIILIVTEP